MDIETVQDGLRELVKLSNGYVPTEADLADAPLLTNWCIGYLYGQPQLLGDVTGHPKLADQAISTSVLLAIDPAAGWARTISRYYRLGRQLGQGDNA